MSGRRLWARARPLRCDAQAAMARKGVGRWVARRWHATIGTMTAPGGDMLQLEAHA